MNAWSELPNAKHIDWVLESIRSHSDIWIQSGELDYDQTWNRAYDQSWRQVREEQARYQTWIQAWEQAYKAGDHPFDQAYKQVWDLIRIQVSGVVLALFAYDDCEKYLSMTFGELKTWAVLTENPQAILLLPMVYVKEQLNENCTVTIA